MSAASIMKEIAAHATRIPTIPKEEFRLHGGEWPGEACGLTQRACSRGSSRMTDCA
jgi:hypothetical protein